MKIILIVFLPFLILASCAGKKTGQEEEIYHNGLGVESPSIDRSVGGHFFSDYYEQTEQLEVGTVLEGGPLN